MKSERTMAHINLHSILRNLVDLCRLDEEAGSLIQDINISLTFLIKGGLRGTLVFSNGQCSMTKEKVKSSMVLYFTSYEHFNKMIEGKSVPIPLKGITKISFLTKTFTALTTRLEYFLKPEKERLEDIAFRNIHTELMLYTAAYAVSEIGNVDDVGKLVSKSIPDGVISMEVGNGPAVSIYINNGYLETKRGKNKKPRAIMAFDNMVAVYELLSGITDSYTLIASEKLKLTGFIPMLDNLDKLLFMVGKYLSKEEYNENEQL